MQKHEYEVLFPPGSMGLELEPVIKSSERELGCRVKDFYFGIDYDGIHPEKLQEKINIGDIICSVDGKSVKSLPFVEVIELLRTSKHLPRCIRFKNIAAACTLPMINCFRFTSVLFSCDRSYLVCEQGLRSLLLRLL